MRQVEVDDGELDVYGRISNLQLECSQLFSQGLNIVDLSLLLDNIPHHRNALLSQL